jgi:hypothetical protein
MIDPLHALAFSVQANRGVYALLLGSGVSRAAQIPTGWEITLDLVRRQAEAAGETAVTDFVSWYRERHQKEPNYSDLLDEMAPTAAERQLLLRPYIEPSEAERAEGLRAPTVAHHAIADLAAKGFIRVIITTNFDRLMEAALEAAGVVPTVISSVDQLDGAMPLMHSGCYVLKVHGDYLDTRIRNTLTELESYPSKLNDQLGRIFDEFGLIVCGWSAEWDTALRNAIERFASRRFTHFWAVRGELGNAAKQLIQHRKAQTLSITDADSFFSELRRLVEALEDASRPHPLSTEAAVASLKRYLTEPKHRIQMADLVSAEVGRVLNAISGPAFDLNAPELNTSTFTARIRGYDAACETLIAMAATGGRWVEEWHYPIWERAIKQLATRRSHSGLDPWIASQRYPATQLLYALGLGALEAGEPGLLFLGKLFSIPIAEGGLKDKRIVELLPPFKLFKDGKATTKLLEGMDARGAPLNEWLRARLQPRFPGVNSGDTGFIYEFDKFEVLVGLSYSYHTQHRRERYVLPPVGPYTFNHDNRNRAINEFRSSLDIESLGDQSPYVRASVFGQSLQECTSRLECFSQWVEGLGLDPFG